MAYSQVFTDAVNYRELEKLINEKGYTEVPDRDEILQLVETNAPQLSLWATKITQTNVFREFLVNLLWRKAA